MQLCKTAEMRHKTSGRPQTSEITRARTRSYVNKSRGKCVGLEWPLWVGSGLGLSARGMSMLQLSDKWAPRLLAQAETGMGYQIVRVRLHDGREFEQATVVEGVITDIQGKKEIPFSENEIADLIVTG